MTISRPRAVLRRHGPQDERALGADAGIRHLLHDLDRLDGLGYSLAFAEGSAYAAAWIVCCSSGLTLDGGTGTIPESVFMMFQMTFAIITPALIVGAFVERMKFSAMLVFIVLWSLVVYAPIAHWVWGPGGFF